MPLYFGVFVSLFAYLIGMELKKKFGWPVLNPLLVAIILVIAFLKATGITYTDYNEGASYISYFLTPATVCLAIPLYKQLELLKKNLTAVATAITAGVIGSVVSVYVMSMVFKLEHVHYVSLLPKSITTAIGMGVSEEAGGIVTMTIVSMEISLRTAGSSSSESRSLSRRGWHWEHLPMRSELRKPWNSGKLKVP